MTGAVVTRSASTREVTIPWICASCRAFRHQWVSGIIGRPRSARDDFRRKQCTLLSQAHSTSAPLRVASSILKGVRSEAENGRSRPFFPRGRHGGQWGLDEARQASDTGRVIEPRRNIEKADGPLDPAALLSTLSTTRSAANSDNRSRTNYAPGQRPTRTLLSSQRPAHSNFKNDRSGYESNANYAAPEPQDVKWNTAGMADHHIAFITSLLCRFHPSINLTQIRSIYLELQNFGANPRNPRAPPLIYERLITSYLNLRNPAGAIEVYNAFIKAGHEPTLKTYAILMRGAAKGRDMKALQAFWGHLKKSGLKPDAYIWSILIFGLIRTGRIEEGVQALEVMGMEWIEAARAESSPARRKPHSKLRPTQSASNMNAAELLAVFAEPMLKDGTPKPTTVVMNTAIAALASRKSSLVSKVLAWGRQFALEPDRTTYKYMLNISMRQGNSDDALAILKLMESRSIGTDSGTWTVVLRAWFDSGVLLPLSETEVGIKVFGFIDSIRGEMKSSVDEQGYAIIINAFLKHHGSAILAHRAIEHMVASGLRPTTHIYTMLATYFFHNPKISQPETTQSLRLHDEGQQQPDGDLKTLENQLLDDEDWQMPSKVPADTSSRFEVADTSSLPQTFALDASSGSAPDYASLAALWTQTISNGTKGAGLDAVYFDRLIEGYAVHHRTSPDRLSSPPTTPRSKRDLDAVEPGFPMVWPALRLMGSLGLKPSWRALEALVRALAERGEWHDFRKIVERARHRVRLSQGSEGVSRRFQRANDNVHDRGSSIAPSSAFGQKSFWRFVISTGYLDREGVARAEDIMLALSADNDTTDSRLAEIAHGP
nr:pentatricopeptide repeat-containing protein, chloroplastic [Quercus suber]